mgnify:CR=1 FL=1
MKLTFFGAARAVTGSCHCVECGGKKILVDCGLQQGRDERDNQELDFAAGYIDAVVVTHAHIDHSGRIPLLVKQGFTGNIYCTDDYGEDHVIAYDDGIVAVQDLLNGKVDAVVIDKSPAQEFVAANPGLVILDTEYANEDYAIGVAKGNTALVDAVNGALAELTADGTIQSIIEKYIPAEG